MATGTEMKFQRYILSLFYHTSVLHNYITYEKKCRNQNFTFLGIFPLNADIIDCSHRGCERSYSLVKASLDLQSQFNCD